MNGAAVGVWLVPADLPEALLARLSAALDEGERRRLDEILHAGERRRFLAAHGASRAILAGLLGVPAGQLRWEPGVNGKPHLSGQSGEWHTNLSHSGDLCLLAVANREVGVDVQQLSPGLDPVAMARRRYPPDEASYVADGADHAERLGRFTTLWARKEACVKAAGGRLMQGMALPAAGTSPVLVAPAGGPLPGPFRVTDVPVPQGYCAAVAVNGDEPFHVDCRWWPGEPDTTRAGRGAGS